MRRPGYSMAGIVLGVILGHVRENAFVKAMPIMDYNVANFLHQPISITLLAAATASIFLN